MDLLMVRLLIKKRKGSHRFYIDDKQYSLKEVVAYIKLHPSRMVHIVTIENESMLYESYIPTQNPHLQKIIELAAKAKIYKRF